MLALVCFAVAIYLPCRCWLFRRKARLEPGSPDRSAASPSASGSQNCRRAWLIAFVFAALGGFLLPDRLVLQKHLTQLALPGGLAWLLMAGLCLLAWEQRRRYALCGLLLAWSAYTLAGNEWLSHYCLSRLQEPYAGIDPLAAGPFDAVVVLGGSVGDTPSGQTQLTDAGDRVMLGARLFLTGRTANLVTTGSRIRGLSEDARDQSERTAEIWTQLGIPAERIHRVGGRTTQEESQSIGTLIGQRGWKRLGLVTSAWHMSRAQRLMQAQGLTMEPLPANFEAHAPDWTDFSLVPEPSAFARMERACKEVLAGLVGR